MHRRRSAKPPAIDGPKARAKAQLFLAGARSLEHVTAQSLAHQCQLSPKVAEYLLTVARQRREAGQ